MKKLLVTMIALLITAGSALATGVPAVIIGPNARIVAGSSSVMYVDGANWTNNSSYGLSGTGKIILKGTTAHAIGGTLSSLFYLLELNNPAGVALGQSATVESGLTLTSGKLTLGNSNLLMKSGSAIFGSYSTNSTNYIVATGTGELRKEQAATGSFTFHVGDATKYSPASLTYSSGTFAAGAYSGVKVAQSRLSGDASVNDYLNRTWTVSSSGISSFSATAALTYPPGTPDVVGTEAAIKTGGTFTGTSANSNSITHTLSATNISAFGTFGGISQAPIVQARNISFGTFIGDGTGMTVSWTNGNGGNRAVFAKLGNSGSAAPVYGSNYSANAAFGSGTQIGSSGWYCVYKGSGSSIAVTGLTASTAYQFHVIEYNISTNDAYLVTTATANPSAQVTKPAPTQQATALTFSGVATTGMTVNWTNGNGASRKVFMLQGTSGTFAPVNGTDYAATADFSSSADLGSGWKCVYSGTGSSAAVTGLTAATAYQVYVAEYDGTGVTTVYNSGTTVSNPLNKTTASAYTISTTAGSISYTTGDTATVVDSGFTLTGADITNFAVTIGNFKSGDMLAWDSGSLPSGVTGSYVDTTGVLTFTGSAATADWQTLLRTVTYYGTNAGVGTRSVTFANSGLSLSASRIVMVGMHAPGNALNFDNVDDVVAFTTPATYNNSALTVEAWVNTTSASTMNDIISWAKNGVRDLATLRTSNGKISFGARDETGGWEGVEGTRIVNDGIWHHLAVVKNGTAITFYVDGLPDAVSSHFLNTPLTNDTEPVIARNPVPFDRMYLGKLYELNGFYAGSQYTGSLDEVRVWNTVRSQAEIQASMSSSLIGSETGLAAYYRFDQGTGSGTNTSNTTLLDQKTTGTLFDGTLTNFALTGTASNWVDSYAMISPVASAASASAATSFTANWSAPTSGVTPTAYYLDVATNVTFTSFVSGYNNLNVGNVTSKSVTGLTANTVYYYRVRAYYDVSTLQSASSSTITASTFSDSTAPVTTLSIPGGSYSGPQSVTLTCTDSGSGCAAIYYTTNGATPTTASTSISGSSGTITISSNIMLKYFAKDNAGNTETAKTATYTVTASGVTVSYPTKAGTTFTVKRVAPGNSQVTIYTGAAKTFTDTEALLSNTIYFYTVTSDSDPSVTTILTIRTPLYRGWNLVGVPYNTTGIAYTQLFGSAVSALYEWVPTSSTDADNNGYYINASTMTPGKGYFVRAGDASTMLMHSGSENPSSVDVTLKPGYTLISIPAPATMTSISTNWLIDGNPLEDAITAIPPTIDGSLYWWNGSTYDSWSIMGVNPTIEPWKAYWMLNLDTVNHILTIK